MCGLMLITISKTIVTSNAIMKNMLTYMQFVRTLVMIFANQLAFHAVTGTTSYFFRASKVKTFKKLLSNRTKKNLSKELGKTKKNI